MKAVAPGRVRGWGKLVSEAGARIMNSCLISSSMILIPHFGGFTR
jgi:hypothetical protein